jgi:hypothetical protein
MSILGFGFTAILSLLVLVITAVLLRVVWAVLNKAASSRSHPYLLTAGLLVLAILLAPLQPLIVFFQTNFLFPLLVVPLILMLASLLMKAAVFWKSQPAQAEQRDGSAPWLSAASLILGVLLLLAAGLRLFWFLVWDSTYDPIGGLFFLPLLAASTGCGLALALIRRKEWIPFKIGYQLALPALVIGVYALAAQVDFRQLSAQRLHRIGTSVERYQASHGSYPYSP